MPNLAVIQIAGEGDYDDNDPLPIFQAELSDFTQRTKMNYSNPTKSLCIYTY